MKTLPTQIVLLGGGYVSVLAYQSMVKRLRRQLKQGTVQITVVCPLRDHTFHGWTAETLTGVLQADNQLSPLAEVMPLAKLLVAQAEAIDTDWQTVKIRLEDGAEQTLFYDQLLIGYGSFDSEAIEGIREYGYQVKARDAFHQTRDTLYDLVQQAAQTDALTARQLLTFTVAGGGFTGVELASNIMEYVQLLKKSHPSLQTIEPQVWLVHSGLHILAALPEGCERLVQYAEKTLAESGVEVIANRRITKLTETGVFLNDDTFLPSRMVISTVGQSRVRLSGTGLMERDTIGRLCTNANLQIAGYENIWGGGDACHVKRPKTETACPANALWAIKHGEHVGRNMARAVLGQKIRPFTFRGLGEAASLGMGKGIGELYGILFTGWLAWVLRLIFFHYFMPSPTVRLRAMRDWAFLFFRGKRKGVWMMEQSRKAQTVSSPGYPSSIQTDAHYELADIH
ncbi:NAD(P)/FAD-dependent oxidoreductase [Spirosoma harenae]